MFFSGMAQANALLTMTPPKVEISKVEFVRLEEKNLELNVSFVVKNTNSNDININAIRYEMLVSGKSVAKDYHEQKIFLNANSLTTVVLPVSLDVMRLFSIVPEALVVNQLEFDITFAF